MILRSIVMCGLLVVAVGACAQERIFSGPQPGERTTPFKVLDVTGPNAGKETDYVAVYAGAPTVTVFIHGIERSLLPLMNVVDQYSAERKEKLRAHFVFLGADRVALEQRLPLVKQSIKWRAPMTISLNGAEGPGNYGLNKECLLTIVVASENRVTANFALVQPGITDAPRVIAAMAKAAGDSMPPTADELEARRKTLFDRAGPGRNERMERPNGVRQPAPLDPAKFDLKTEDGLRAAVTALLAEVGSLRRELAALRGAQPPGAPRDGTVQRPGTPLPGAAPTDTRLITMLRRFIQPSNDDAAVDQVLKEVEDYIRGNADLKRQAIDGWVRVIHLKYGTEYARTTGQAMVERLKK